MIPMGKISQIAGCAILTLLFLQASTLAQPPASGGVARLNAWPQHLAMQKASPFNDQNWKTLGPKFVGGRIESIDVPRGDRNTIYAGVGAGGIWKSENGGLTWRPIFDKESTFAIGDITIAPSNPNVIWAGTGECHLSRTSYPGNGVFKSKDAGETWENMGLHDSAHIGRIAIDPTDENLVYVACMGRINGGGQRGIFKSTDGGRNFKQVLSKGDRIAFVDLVIDPNQRSRLFASSWDRSGQGDSGVFRSDDFGETWTRLGGGLLNKKVDRIAIDVATSQPNVLYALMCDASSPELAKRRPASILYRSEDAGKTWQRTSEDYVPTYIGWDFCDLRVAPDDANRVYVGGLRLIVSEDGGKTFNGEGGFAINKDPQQVFRLHPHRGIGMHLDVHDVWIDPEDPSRIMLGNDGGLYVSWNRGGNWLHLNNLPIAEFYRVHIDQQTPFQIWGGTQDNASLVAPSSAEFTSGIPDAWQLVFLDPWSGGDGFSTFPDPNDPQTTFYTQQNGALKRSKLGRLSPEKSIQPRRSNTQPDREPGTAGEPGTADSKNPKDRKSGFEFAWDTPFFASTHSGETVLYCAAQCVMQSDDHGNSWKRISPDLSRRGIIALDQSPLEADRFAAGFGRGNVHLTTDHGANWNNSNGLPKKMIRDIELSPHQPNRVYVALSGKADHDPSPYLFVSNDFGESWIALHNGLPSESINAVAVDPNSEETLFVGTDLGVYVSIDRGKTWHSLCQSLPSASVVDLAVHKDEGILVAATHGLGMFSFDLQSIRKAAEKTD